VDVSYVPGAAGSSGVIQLKAQQSDNATVQDVGSVAIKVRDAGMGVCYQPHVGNIGWMAELCDGAVAGVPGSGNGLQAVKLRLMDATPGARICYQAHVAGIGWQAEVCDNQQAGTTGQALDMHAIRIRLVGVTTGERVCYQAYVRTRDWQAEVCDNEQAGTTGLALPLEGLKVRILPGSTGTPMDPVVDVASANAGTTRQRDLCVRIALPGDAASECGDLVLTHALPTTRTFNQARTPMLLYTSQTAHPYALVAANVMLPVGAAQADRVEAALKVSGTERARVTYSGTDWSPGETRRIVLGYDASSQQTDLYPYTLEVTHWYGTTAKSVTVTGEFAVINRANSPFGAGWWLAGLEEIKVLPGNHRLWVGGDGSSLIYRYNGATNTWIGPQLAGVPDTIYSAFGSVPGESKVYYLRSLRDGAQIWYDDGGRQIGTRSRLGHITRFDYTNEGPSGSASLKTLSLPVPGTTRPTYTFSYVSGRLRTVSAPPLGSTARTVGVTNVSGRITQIQDPDLKAVQFGYTSSTGPNRLTDRTDRRGTRVQYSYRGTGLVEWAHLYMQGTGEDIRLSITPAEGRGAAPQSAALAEVFTWIDGPRPDSVALDHTSIWTDRFGAPKKVVNALGDTMIYVRDNRDFPALVTQVDAPGATFNGAPARLVTEVFYNDRAKPDSIVVRNPLGDGRPAVTRYEWEAPYWKESPSKVTGPEGETTTFGYDARGNRTSEIDGEGNTTTYGYDGNHGLLRSVTTPSQHTSWVEYDLTPANGLPGMGNLYQTKTPSGFTTTYVTDAIGRTTEVQSQVDVQGIRKQRQRIYLDAMGRDTLTISDGTGFPADSLQQTLRVRKQFDPEGSLLRLSRISVPDPAAIDTIVTAWTYDRAGRVIREVAPGSTPRHDEYSYDPAGNLLSHKTRREHTIEMKYDELNRLIRRVIPGHSYGATADTLRAGNLTHVMLFPQYAGSTASGFTEQNTRELPLVIDGDVEEYSYDAMGNLRSATNRDAVVRRGYYPNGALRADTLKIRTYEGNDTTSHVYVLGYTYDRSGRRLTMSHPAGIVPSRRDTTSYTYRPETGRLNGLVDPRGNSYRYTYTVDGQPEKLIRDHFLAEEWFYDAEGLLEERREWRGGTLLHQDRYVRDAQGRIVSAYTLGDSTRNSYAPLGGLARSFTDRFLQVSNPEEEHVLDALGNVTSTLRNMQSRAVDETPREWLQYTYERRTGRLRSTKEVIYDLGGPNEVFAGRDYDAAGNLEREGSGRYVPYPGGVIDFYYNGGLLQDRGKNYYGADDRLRVVDRQSCVFAAVIQKGGRTVECLPPYFANRGAFEEYRYDALGRRILVHTRQAKACEANCQFAVTRFIWDGDEILYEIRAPMEQDTGFVVGMGNGMGMYGRVLYTHGGTLDRPLAITRVNYDTLFPPVQVVFPHTDWRGQFDQGTWDDGMPTRFADGKATRCVALPPPIDNIPENPENPNPGDPGPPSEQDPHWGSVCVEIDWPAPYLWQSMLSWRMEKAGPAGWWGSLMDNKRDGSGKLYMRNRYYDPETGRFTQEDPIGIAGGLNLYGYANGDPVNFSDPFGLSPCLAGPVAMRLCSAVALTAGGALGAAAVQVYNNYQSGADLSSGVGLAALEGARDGAATALGAEAVAAVGGRLAGIGLRATAGAANSLSAESAALMNARPTGSALKADPQHRAATFMREEAAKSGSHFQIVGGDGVTRTLTQVRGGFNGKVGRYEYMIDPSGALTHQRFVKGGTINGVPNVP
jgi:RHS repeat-associated protein